jgi:hypothetical protein
MGLSLLLRTCFIHLTLLFCRSKLAGKLLIGRESLTFLTGNDQVCFSHSYLVLVWYELTASLAYAIKGMLESETPRFLISSSATDNKTLVSYHFDLEDTSIGLLHAMDEKVASVLGESNSKDGGRRSGGRSKVC